MRKNQPSATMSACHVPISHNKLFAASGWSPCGDRGNGIILGCRDRALVVVSHVVHAASDRDFATEDPLCEYLMSPLWQAVASEVHIATLSDRLSTTMKASYSLLSLLALSATSRAGVATPSHSQARDEIKVAVKDNGGVSVLSPSALAGLAPYTQFARAAYCESSKIKGWNCGRKYDSIDV